MSIHALTKRQQAVLNFIRQHIQNDGVPPSFREIGDHFAIRSPNGVKCHLGVLERKGMIIRKPRSARHIRLVEAPDYVI